MSRDDMVIRPQIPAFGRITPRGEAAERRRFDKAKRKGGGIRRGMRRAHRAARMRGTLRGGKPPSVRHAVHASRLGRAMYGSRGFSAGGRALRAIATPMGMAVTGVAVIAAVIVRLASGRSFENLGQNFTNLLLGDADDKARAAAHVRGRMTQDADLMRAVGVNNKLQLDIKKAFDLEMDHRLQYERGRSKIMEDKRFQVNTWLDILIIQARDYLMKLFADRDTFNKFVKFWRVIVLGPVISAQYEVIGAFHDEFRKLLPR